MSVMPMNFSANKSKHNGTVDPIAAAEAAGISFERCLITVDFAKAALANNKINRPLKPGSVRKYAWDMLNGKWDTTEECIAFDASGALVQGQHRMAALIAAGVSVWMYVARNAPSIWAVRDRGTVRGQGCFLRWADGSHANERCIARVLSSVHALGSTSATAPSTSVLQGVIDAHEEGLRWAYAALPAKTHSVVIAALAYAQPVAPAIIEQFAKSLSSGANLEVDSPVLTLSQSLRAAPPVGKGALFGTYRTLAALRAAIQGRSLKRLEGTTSAYEWFKGRRLQMGLPQ